MHVLLLYSITQLITRFPLLISSSSDCVLALHHRDRERERKEEADAREARREGWQRGMAEGDEMRELSLTNQLYL